MAYAEHTTDCCGIIEGIGMNDPKWTPEKYLKEILQEDLYGFGAVGNILAKKHLLFSVAYRRAAGPKSVSQRPERLKDFVEKNKLGTVIISEQKKNSSGNMVKVGVFTADIKKMGKWIEENVPQPDEDSGYDSDECNCIDCRRDRQREWL